MISLEEFRGIRVGDKVRLANLQHGYFCNDEMVAMSGSVCTVSETHFDNTYHLNGNGYVLLEGCQWFWDNTMFDNITTAGEDVQSPSISYKQFQELRVGDYVRIREDIGTMPNCSDYMRLFAGKVVKIEYKNSSGANIVWGYGYSFYYYHFKEKVDTPENFEVTTGGTFRVDNVPRNHILIYIPKTDYLRKYNSEPFSSIIEGNYAIMNYNTKRIINALNPHLAEKLEAAHIRDYRLDGVCFYYGKDFNGFFHYDDDGDSYEEDSVSLNVNFSTGEFSLIETGEYEVCSNCGERVLKDRIIGRYCRYCLTSGGGLAYRYSYHEYRGGYPAPAKVDTSKTPIFGCEIERDYREEDDDSDFSNNLKQGTIDVLKTFQQDQLDNGSLERQFVFMYDGSLNCGGVEWITFPHTFDWYVKNKDKFQVAIEKLKEHGFTDTKSAGNHIHINRDFFGRDAEFDAAKIALLFNTYWEEFVAIAGRDLNRCSYTQKPIQKNTDSVFEVVKKTLDTRGEHGIAVNLQHSNTIEIRLWSAIKDADDLIFFLDNMQALARFAKKSSLERVQRADLTDYMKYFKLKSSLKMVKDRLTRKRITRFSSKIDELLEKVGK